MKALRAFFAILLTFTFTSAITLEQAEAKRLGSGKSFGTSYKTAPAPTKSTTDSTATPAQQSTAAAAPARKGGLMGGMMGGLLAGGLLAALFAGGAFEGLQLMDILIMAVLAFVIFKVVRSLRQGNAMARSAPQPAYAGAGASQPLPTQPASRPAFGSTAAATPFASHGVPLNLPLGFSTPAFLEGAKEHYRTLQNAWNCNDLATIEEYMTPALFAELSAERAGLATAPQTEVLSLNAELVRGEQAFGKAEVSVRFSGHYRDAGEGVTDDFVDIWHLSRDYSVDNAPWFITGIASE